tara:strand:- start:55 stop:642 length:588 start_codon:yes stop_codon:yes gene_type:complete
MPCTKCEEGGKYKWGKTGSCKYATKADCESDNKGYYKKNTMKPTPLGKKTYEEYEKELKEYNLSKVERVELGIIDDLKKDVETARKQVEGAERLHKAAEKDDAEINKLASEYIALEAKADKMRKETRELIKFGKENIKEAKSLLSKSKKTASTIEQQLKDLGLDKKVISSELSEIDKLNSTLKSLDFAFLDDLPF